MATSPNLQKLKELTTKLSTKESFFKKMLDCAPEGIIITNSDANIKLINKKTEELFLYNRDELIGKPIEILVPDRVKISHVDLRNKYIQDPYERKCLLVQGLRKDNKEIDVKVSVNPVWVENELLFCCVVRDSVSERTETNVAR